MKVPEIQTNSITDQLYDYLKNAILEGEYKPGDKLEIDRIANELKISRSPIKTAIDKLKGEGFIEVKPRQGTFITKLSKKELLEYLEIRFVIETYIVDKYIDRFDHTVLEKLKECNQKASEAANVNNTKKYIINDKVFHKNIIDQCPNKNLKDLYQRLHIHTAVIMAQYKDKDRQNSLFNSCKEHEEIIKALERKDGHEARKAMTKHCETVIEDCSKNGQF